MPKRRRAQVKLEAVRDDEATLLKQLDAAKSDDEVSELHAEFLKFTLPSSKHAKLLRRRLRTSVQISKELVSLADDEVALVHVSKWSEDRKSQTSAKPIARFFASWWPLASSEVEEAEAARLQKKRNETALQKARDASEDSLSGAISKYEGDEEVAAIIVSSSLRSPRWWQRASSRSGGAQAQV